MPDITIRLLGERELQEKFSELQFKVQKSIIRDSARIAMRPVLQSAKQKAPRDTGILKRNIVLRAGRRSRNWIRINVGTRNREKFPDSVRKGNTAKDWFYPAIIEYAKELRINSGSYLRSSLDEKESQVRQKFKRLLRINILRAAKGGKGIKLRSLQRRVPGSRARG